MSFRWDAASLQRLKALHPSLVEMANTLGENTLDQMGRQIRISQGLRTYPEQDELYSQGRDGPGRVVTYARAGQSDHNFGIACDVCFQGKDPYLAQEKYGHLAWNQLGQIGKDAGLFWGGDWVGAKMDRPHFNLKTSLTMPQLDTLYKQGGLEAVYLAIDNESQGGDPNAHSIEPLP